MPDRPDRTAAQSDRLTAALSDRLGELARVVETLTAAAADLPAHTGARLLVAVDGACAALAQYADRAGGGA